MNGVEKQEVLIYKGKDMKFKVHGGTHLGIVGCYGERIFDVEMIEEIEEIIRKEEGLQKALYTTYISNNFEVVHCLVDPKNGATLFEYTIISRMSG